MIANGKKLPHWKHSSHRMYLGHADKYASSVPLILNLQTGSIMPQFHFLKIMSLLNCISMSEFRYGIQFL
jgi:hypothetical protein